MKKRILSLILSAALIGSAVPVDNVEAAEIIVPMETADTFLNDYHICSAGESEKVVGSNGKAYDEITYLSVDTVRALDEDKRTAYIALCDEMASWIEGGYELNKGIIAVDSDGDINWYWSVPVRELSYFQDEMSADMMTDIDVELLNDVQSERQKDTEEAEISAETESESLTETDLETEEPAEIEDETETETESETGNESATESEAETESESLTETDLETEESAEIEDETETETESETENESLTEIETETESKIENESSTEIETETESENTTETENESLTEIETETESETETETETADNELESLISLESNTDGIEIIVSENMNILPEIIEDYYEVTEDEPVEIFIDLGNGIGIHELGASLPSENYFYNQLQGIEKNVFNAGKGKLTDGKTVISFKGPSSYSLASICQGISALILTYSDKFDWMDLSTRATVDVRGVAKGSETNYTLSLSKSEYYSSSLEKSAKEQVKNLAMEAQRYAQQNYPMAPAYGVVEYFDHWICEHNYYNSIGVNGSSASDSTTREIYYYCHSAYGVLLKGYGVCESYALSMSRLLDAVGINNMYVTGNAGGGHAWNYIQMPDKKWYLQDSTWNDLEGAGSNKYLLAGDDGKHTPIGNRYSTYTRAFQFETLSSEKYRVPSGSDLGFEKSTYDLKGGTKLKLSCINDELNTVKQKWSSSNTKVAKVSSNGTVTAVGPGTAVILLTGTVYGIEMKAACTVNVYQVKGMTLSTNNKTSDTVSCGIDGTTGSSKDVKTFVINVDRGGSKYTAQQMVDNGTYTKPQISVSNTKVAAAEYTLEGDKIFVKVSPFVSGNTKITVKFAGKTVTLNCSVGQILKEEWFDISAVPQSAVPYTGKAYKPKIVKTPSAPKDVRYKVKYVNNKDAGTATVIISGTKKYGGDITREFKITQVDIANANFTTCTKSKKYSGKVLSAATTVKLNGKKLSAGKDYDVLYNGADYAISKGVYTVMIVGKGNYTGIVTMTRQFEIK